MSNRRNGRTFWDFMAEAMEDRHLGCEGFIVVIFILAAAFVVLVYVIAATVAGVR